jgi:putative endonuclease
MTGSRRRLGDLGERLAAHHLESKGYLIRERNFRTREGEIDIIAERGEVLVFAEVRTRRGETRGSAVESITPVKQRRLVALAETYGQDRSDLPEGRRIDVIALDLAPDGRLLSVNHIEGAVWAE